MSPPNDQYKLFLRDTKPRKDICLSVECTVLFFSFIFFRGLLCTLCLKWSLFLFSSPSNTSMLFFALVLIHSTIDLTLHVACLSHFFHC